MKTFKTTDGEEDKRLVDYFAVLGISPSTPVRKQSLMRRDSSLQLKPITSLMVVAGEEKISGFDRIDTTAGGTSANLNSGTRSFWSSHGIYFFLSRGDFAVPITGLRIIPRDGRLPRNYERIDQGVLRKHEIVLRKDFDRDPITSIRIINKDKGEKCPREHSEIEVDLNGGILGSECFHLCYKKSPLPRKHFEPQILSRFPEHDWDDYSLPTQMLSDFCFPAAISVVTEPRLPSSRSFVLTAEQHKEVYGCALVYHEAMTSIQVKEMGKGLTHTSRSSSSSSVASFLSGSDLVSTPKGGDTSEHNVHEQSDDELETPITYYAPKCIVILSHQPFYQQFTTFLIHLHRIALSPNANVADYLHSIFFSIPVPRPCFSVKFKIGHGHLDFQKSPLINLPYYDFDLQVLFRHLNIETIVTLFDCLLSESKLLLYSEHLGVLTPIAEALRSLLFPFQWPYPFIPVLPLSLSNMLLAPVPFIVGIHKSFLDQIRVGKEVVMVDIDRCEIKYMHGFFPVPKILPESLRSDLIRDLVKYSTIYQPRDDILDESMTLSFVPLQLDEDSVFLETDIRLTFLKVFVRLLENYNSFVSQGTFESIASNAVIFGTKEFIARQPEQLRLLAQNVSVSQYFTRFIELRTSLQIPFELVFFDFCIALWKEGCDFRNVLGSLVSPGSFRTQQNTISVETVKCKSINEDESDIFTFPSSKSLIRRSSSTIGLFRLSDLVRDDVQAAFNRCWLSFSETLSQSTYTRLRRSSSITSSHLNFSKEKVANSWIETMFSRHFEIWVNLNTKQALKSCKCAKCKLFAFSSLMDGFLALLRASSLNISISEKSFEFICRLCLRQNFFTLFKMIYELLHSTCIQPSSDFFYALLNTERSFASVDQSGFQCTDQLLKPSASALPDAISISGECEVCNFKLGGNYVVSGWISSVSSAIGCPSCGNSVDPVITVICDGKRDSYEALRFDQLSNRLDARLAACPKNVSILDHVTQDETLRWNLVWAFSMANLPFASLLGVSKQPHICTRFSLFDPWVIGFKKGIDLSKLHHESIGYILSMQSEEDLEHLLLPLREKRVGKACQALIRMRALSEGEEGFLTESMFLLLASLNEMHNLMDHALFAKKFTTELSYFGYNARDDLKQRDKLDTLSREETSTRVRALWLHYHESLRNAKPSQSVYELQNFCTMLSDLDFDLVWRRGIFSSMDQVFIFPKLFKSFELFCVAKGPTSEDSRLINCFSQMIKFRASDDPGKPAWPRDRIRLAIKITESLVSMGLDVDPSWHGKLSKLLKAAESSHSTTFMDAYRLDINGGSFPSFTIFDPFLDIVVERLTTRNEKEFTSRADL